MQGDSPPPLGSYRRLQVARHLLMQEVASPGDFRFSIQGRLVDFGLAGSQLENALADGQAFRTSGCPGCNRPYYNEPPRGPLYNFPRRPSAGEVRRAVAEALS